MAWLSFRPGQILYIRAVQQTGTGIDDHRAKNDRLIAECPHNGSVILVEQEFQASWTRCIILVCDLVTIYILPTCVLIGEVHPDRDLCDKGLF